MKVHMMSSEDLGFSSDLSVKAETITRGMSLRSKISLTPAEEIALAKRFQFLSISNVAGTLTVKLCASQCWELTSHLTATVIQACVVSGDPVSSDLNIDVVERFVSKIDKSEEIDATGVDIELLDNGYIPIGDAILQAIGVFAPAYPRSPTAPILGEPEYADENNPFAKLSELKK